jgi:sialic acid synthase SpsE
MKITAAAIAAGADVIEKHIALKNQKKGFDIKFSIKDNEIKKLKNIMNETYKLVEKKFFYRNKNEKINLKFRRSIFAVRDIKKGEKFTKNNIRRIRPGFGLSPVYYEKILNKKSSSNISRGEPIKLINIDKKIRNIK